MIIYFGADPHFPHVSAYHPYRAKIYRYIRISTTLYVSNAGTCGKCGSENSENPTVRNSPKEITIWRIIVRGGRKCQPHLREFLQTRLY